MEQHKAGDPTCTYPVRQQQICVGDEDLGVQPAVTKAALSGPERTLLAQVPLQMDRQCPSIVAFHVVPEREAVLRVRAEDIGVVEQVDGVRVGQACE